MNEKRKRLVDTLEAVLDRLDAALQRPKDEFMRDSAIQRFEFTFEVLPDHSRVMREAPGVLKERS